MRKFLSSSVVVLALVLMSSFAVAGSCPELRGTWVGLVKMIAKDGTLKESKAVFVIKKQEGKLFTGNKAWFAENKENLITEGFSGVVDEDGGLYFAEHDDGYTFGKMVGKERMSLYYLESGRKAKVIQYSMERVRFARAFVDIDKDGNKTIIRSEIVKVYPLNAERIMREADLNKDGKLSKKEWEEWKKDK
ncbi:calcium-binding protein [Maridesulfovibrio sp.]|uniref:calcium-binding protein n=1 Tax=unclassified Maridesulfovibrio TaxID=2794999 RepID=UPI003B007C48